MKQKSKNPCEICRTGDGKPVNHDGMDMVACEVCLNNRHIMAHAKATVTWERGRRGPK